MNQIPLTMQLKGWLHKSPVVLLVLFVGLLGFGALICRYVLPVNFAWGIGFLVAIGVLILITTIVGCIVVFRMDSTEQVSAQQTTIGWSFAFQSPSTDTVAFIQKFIRQIPRAQAMIPMGVDPKSDPKTFTPIPQDEAEKMVSSEFVEALQQAPETPTQEGISGSDTGATMASANVGK